MLIRLLVAAIAAASLSFTAYGQGRLPAAGKEYLVLPAPQPTETPGKIEVVEFFWYRCPHCYALEPLLEPWVKRLPPDTQFRRIPAVFNDEWALDARIFFALDALGAVDRLHGKLFNAIHTEGGVKQQGQAYVKWVTAWLAKQGVNTSKFEAAMRSFAVDTKVKRANQVAQAYQLDGVPTLAVEGRYIVSASMVGDQRTMLGVTDYLISQVRGLRPGGQGSQKQGKK